MTQDPRPAHAARPPRPQVFRLDDAGITLAPDPLPLDTQETPVSRPATRGAIRLGALFWGALGGLVSLGIGLAVLRLVEDLFARLPWLGYVGLGFAALLAFAVLAIGWREGVALHRLTRIDTLRARAERALEQDDTKAARAVARDVLALSSEMPELARARAELSSHLGAIIDGADLIRLVERTLMTDLDGQARQMVSDAAKRVSVVTAVSPRALVDVAFVLVTALGLVRGLSRLYGGRPGTLGMIRLIRHVVSHLAITGGLAAGDTLIQQVVGHGLAARLSARLGEGVVNGLLTARLGLAAIAVTRPLPFSALPAPSLPDVATGLLRKPHGQDAQAKAV